MISNEKILGPLPTNGEVYKRAFQIAWPSALETILVALIGAIDTMMVGGLGTNAIAAVGICTQPKFIIMATLLGLNTGVNVVVARRKGEERQDEANKTLRNALLLSFSLSLLLSTIGFVFAEPMLMLAGASADYLSISVVYFRYIMIGTFFQLMSLTMTAAQRGAGKTKISMVCNLSANFVNVIMNALLINGLFFFPRLEVAGAAIATMIGNIVAFLLALITLLRNNGYLHIHLKDDWKLDADTLRAIFKISIPSLVEQIFLRIGFFTYSRAVANLGTIDYATHLICMNVMTISFGLGDGLSIASSTLVGQSLGAKRSDLAIIYGKVLQRIGLLMSIIMGIGIALFNTEIMYLFSKDILVIEKGETILLMLALVIQFQVNQVITMGCLRGAGDAKFVAFISLITITFIRPIGTYVLAYGVGLGLVGAWLSIYLDQITRLLTSKYRFNQAEWMKIQV
ncbi:MAG: MATE family efflux transporter [Erysipelotrichaceae bacterium]|nr:MATE family efflux transporter [Erysipelotrichaceae bacterium]